MKTKFIVITGGGISGLGKGVAIASIGCFFPSDLKIIPIKCDGYLNADTSTMAPMEHGEVFVLEDGAEVDMDFGHSLRFLDISCKSHWNLTMGKIFHEILSKERKGDYLGKTVQFIPHVTDLIKKKIIKISEEEKSDITLVEIGGTVGDIENELFLESVRQLRNDIGKENIIFVHLTYIPIIIGSDEQKSKPTQQSVNLLMKRGIIPDIIIGRCSEILTDKIKDKISTFCNVEKDAVITGLDTNIIYEIPINFEKEGLSKLIYNKFQIKNSPNSSKLKKWKKLIYNIENPEKEITIAMCGKYTELEDSYASIIESFNHCSAHLKCKINLKWIETTKLKDVSFLDKVDGILVPGGFGPRGTEGKIKIIKYARENNIPFLGICLGLQLAIVEFARNVCNLKNANSTEIDKNTSYPVIDILPEQKNITEKGATMRRGSCISYLKEKSVVYKLYKKIIIEERHRHRYEVNPDYHSILKENKMIFSGTSRDGRLVEFIELPNLKFFVATQAHPELKSKIEKPAPLFYGFIKACVEKKGEE